MSNKFYQFDSFNEFHFPLLNSIILQDVKDANDRRNENPAIFAKLEARKLATITTISKSLAHVQTMIKS